MASLQLDPLDAQIRQVVFFDTPDLALQSAGVVVRARRVQRKGDDSTVKLRPVIPHDLPEDLFYVCMIESSYDPNDVSRVGATGLWQFMPTTGAARGPSRAGSTRCRREGR